MAATKTKKTRRTPVKNGVPTPIESGDVLTLAEAAAYLRVSETDVIKAASDQDLPGRLIGGEWRFLKSSLRNWLDRSPKKFSTEAFLALSGVWKDDPYLDEMLEEIYKRRGRPMIEEKE